jgi:hypothetical protein
MSLVRRLQGNKVTWMIGRGKGWGLIVNNRLVKRPAGDEAKTEAAPTGVREISHVRERRQCSKLTRSRVHV